VRRTFPFILLLALSAASVAQADVFRLLDSPRDALQARVDMIEQAHGEIDTLYFLAHDDRVANASLELLLEAHRRGVPKIRLIVDAAFNHIPDPIVGVLLDAGIEVRVYHPLTVTHLNRLLRRMHDKVIVADGDRYIMGGRNLSETYFDLAKNKKNYVDRDVYVQGESARDVAGYFDVLWNSEHVGKLHSSASSRRKRMAADKMARALASLQSDGAIHLATGTDWSAGQPDVNGVAFIHDPIVKNDGSRVYQQMEPIFEGAKKSIVIESQYFVPSKRFLALLEQKRAEGVSIKVLTNSMHSTDGIFPEVAYLIYRGSLLDYGMDVHEYKGPQPLHTKSIVIDDRIAIVGSYNIDPRSENLNTEVMCVADDPVAAESLLHSINVDLQNAWSLKRDGTQNRGVSRMTRLWARIARILLPLIRNQI
jgi:cardiolipin synthase C